MPARKFDPRDPKCLRECIQRFRKVRPDFELLVDYLTRVRLPAIASRLGVYPIILGRAKSL